MGWMKNETGLDKCEANYVPLTPLSHLQRAASIFADQTAVVYGKYRANYREYHNRVSQLASALANIGVEPGQVVATLVPNITAQIEASFGVPACGAVLNTINTRLDPDTIAYIFDHGEAKVVLVDTQFLSSVETAIETMSGPSPLIIEVSDTEANFTASGRHQEYEKFISTGDPDYKWLMPKDEWESLALNYTSGTTGRPKGVVYHHRGAYLMTMGTPVSWRMTMKPVFMAVVPLFHCNGWNHTWMMPLLGGTVVGCRDISAKVIYDGIANEKVSHFGGAPIVLNMIVNAEKEDRQPFDHLVEVFTAGAPPAPATLAGISKLGFNVTQVYGLTETYGHVVECLWNNEWDNLPDEEQSSIKARQGVAMPMMESTTVVDTDCKQIQMDGVTQGEIVMRGNSVMKGYYKNPEATEKAFKNGYFHSEDIAVQHSDGMMQIADRMKDIIISGGENISSIEVESAIMAHPAVSLCAVVAQPDEKWGEVPCAFVELLSDQTISQADLITYVRGKLAGFKTPKRVIFQELPKTSTGKIQKFELRLVAKTVRA